MVLNRLLFGKKYGICAFCGSKIKLSDSVFHKDHACVCSKCNSFIKIAPFDFLYEGTKHISFIIAPTYYSGIIRDAIHNLKFNSNPAIVSVLGYYINTYLHAFEEYGEPVINDFDLLVPVPLSHERKCERGYNQAELLAREISSHFNIPVDTSSLIKVRNTKPQSILNSTERKTNLKDAYSAVRDLTDKRILLVDDVVTTTSTLEFCAEALIKGGAKSVAAIALTHGSTKQHSANYHELFS